MSHREWDDARMQSWRWSVVFAAVIISAFVSRTASAQPPFSVPPPPDVQTRLHSDVAAEVAWGAFYSAQFQIKSAVPAIVERIQSPPSDLDRDQRHHLLADLLDSLIQLDAHVPAAIVLPYSREFPIHTLVLLGSATEGRDQALVGVLREATGEPWYAVANLLLETKPDGFAAVILSGLHLRLSVTVSDLGNSLSGDPLQGAVGGGDGIGQLPIGFPPYAHYSFGGARGASVLALGPTPVYYTRIVRNTFQYPIFERTLSGPTNRDRARYLAELLQPDSVRLDSTTYLPIRWTNASDFSSQVMAAKADLFERYERMISALLRRKRVAEAEARLLPAQIEVQVSDNRTNRSLPLPKVD